MIVWNSQLLFGWTQFESQVSAFANFFLSMIYWLVFYPFLLYEGFLRGRLLQRRAAGLIHGPTLVLFILSVLPECDWVLLPSHPTRCRKPLVITGFFFLFVAFYKEMLYFCTHQLNLLHVTFFPPCIIGFLRLIFKHWAAYTETFGRC